MDVRKKDGKWQVRYYYFLPWEEPGALELGIALAQLWAVCVFNTITAPLRGLFWLIGYLAKRGEK